MARISSSIGAAESVTSGVQSVSQAEKKTIQLSQSNLSGMKSGEEVGNQMLDDLDKLIDCVKEQAGKFTQLAKIKEEMDVADQSLFKK